MPDQESRYSVVVAHGESRSVFYVVDGSAPDGEQPAVLDSFYSREPADAYCARHNEVERLNRAACHPQS